MKDKIIVYERLNLFTFCFSLKGLSHFQNQYFVTYSPRIKKFFYHFIKRAGLKQIHNIVFLPEAIQLKTSDMSIKLGNGIVQDNPDFAKPFIQYMQDQRAKGLVKQTFVYNLAEDIYKFTILQEFIARNGDRSIYYFPTAKNFIVDKISNISKNVIVIKWHSGLLNLIKLIKNLGYLCGLATAPFCLFLRLMLKGKIALQKNNRKISKKAIVFHWHKDLLKSAGTIYRDMYFFYSGILSIADCIHICLHKNSLSIEKTDYLRKQGGETFDFHKQKIRLAHIFRRMFIDYFKYFSTYFFALSFNKFSSFSIIRHLTSIIYRTIELESLLEKIDVKVAFFESEVEFICPIFTIVANKYRIKTMTMLHGIAGYCYPAYNHSNSVVNYFLVPGNYYVNYLQPFSPDVNRFCPIGNHEIEELKAKDIDLEITELPERIKQKLEQLRNSNVKILGVFATFYWPFFPEYQDRWPLFDQGDAKRAFLHYWLPFFKWAAQQAKLFLIFKGKAGRNQFEHPYLKEVMAEISPDKYYQNDNILLKDVIAVSDCTISNHRSSAFYSSLSLGVPAISYDMVMRGYTEVEDCDDRHLIAYEPDELITNLTYILENGLPESIFENIRKNHHAEGKLDNQTPLRIKRLIAEIVQ